jgi:hypothetical protein
MSTSIANCVPIGSAEEIAHDALGRSRFFPQHHKQVHVKASPARCLVANERASVCVCLCWGRGEVRGGGGSEWRDDSTIELFFILGRLARGCGARPPSLVCRCKGHNHPQGTRIAVAYGRQHQGA